MSDSLTPSLTLTKLQRPRVGRKLVPRPHLLDRLNASQSLTLVLAPAGYGKTTLLSTWLETCNIPNAWLSLDGHDDDMGVFVTYVVSAVRTVFPAVADITLAAVNGATVPPPRIVARSLINDLVAVEQDFILVLDDYHVIHNQAIHELLAELVQHPPRTLHLVIASRYDPPLPLAALRARGYVTELRGADLRFTPEESAQFLVDAMALPVDERMISLLAAKTEGWPAGLHLAALSLRQQRAPGMIAANTAGDNRYVMDYLTAEVLSPLPISVQEFLIKTSILDQLCVPLCEVVTGMVDRMFSGQYILEWLERADLFLVPADNQPITPELPPVPIDAEQLDDKPLEVAIAPPPPPQIKPPELQPPPPPEAKKPPPPKQPPPNMVLVEVPDKNEVKDAPEDAKHLSDKNRDVAEETRADKTNLDKESEGKVEASREHDDTKSVDIGGPEDRIRQLEETKPTTDDRAKETDHSGDKTAATGAIVGEGGDNGEEGEGDSTPGILSMRGIRGRGNIADQKDGKKIGKKGLPGINTNMAFQDYERIMGKDKVDDERQVAARKMSSKKGRWERKLEAIKSSLENFTPDVRPGNQTALKTRAHPFALFIARMHRSIHERWGFGFLENLEGKPLRSRACIWAPVFASGASSALGNCVAVPNAVPWPARNSVAWSAS